MRLATRMAAAHFCGVSKFPYENAIEDVTHHLEVREREFAVLDIPAHPEKPQPVMHRRCWRRERRSEAGGRILLDLGRGGGRDGQALFRRSP